MKTPRIGDRVKVVGFLGTFEVIHVQPDGSMTDLKHLDTPGPDYIEREIFTRELIYLNSPEPRRR
ncbi:MAG: hypothetical protein ABSG51_12130 [Terracidiphilus sp.]